MSIFLIAATMIASLAVSMLVAVLHRSRVYRYAHSSAISVDWLGFGRRPNRTHLFRQVAGNRETSPRSRSSPSISGPAAGFPTERTLSLGELEDFLDWVENQENPPRFAIVGESGAFRISFED